MKLSKNQKYLFLTKDFDLVADAEELGITIEESFEESVKKVIEAGIAKGFEAKQMAFSLRSALRNELKRKSEEQRNLEF